MDERARQGDLFAPARPLPDGLVYRRDFLAAEEEAALLAEIVRLPLAEAIYRQFTAKRRILSFGWRYDFSAGALLPAPSAPEFLTPLRNNVGDWTGIPAERFTQALITEYRPGTQLGWHRDVPNFEEVVGISLAGPCRMRFRPYPPTPGRSKDAFALELVPRSAYVMRRDVRWRWQHSIPPTKHLRYSITFRTAGDPARSVRRRAP